MFRENVSRRQFLAGVMVLLANGGDLSALVTGPSKIDKRSLDLIQQKIATVLAQLEQLEQVLGGSDFQLFPENNGPIIDEGTWNETIFGIEPRYVEGVENAKWVSRPGYGHYIRTLRLAQLTLPGGEVDYLDILTNRLQAEMNSSALLSEARLFTFGNSFSFQGTDSTWAAFNLLGGITHNIDLSIGATGSADMNVRMEKFFEAARQNGIDLRGKLAMHPITQQAINRSDQMLPNMPQFRNNDTGLTGLMGRLSPEAYSRAFYPVPRGYSSFQAALASLLQEASRAGHPGLEVSTSDAQYIIGEGSGTYTVVAQHYLQLYTGLGKLMNSPLYASMDQMQYLPGNAIEIAANQMGQMNPEGKPWEVVNDPTVPEVLVDVDSAVSPLLGRTIVIGQDPVARSLFAILEMARETQARGMDFIVPILPSLDQFAFELPQFREMLVQDFDESMLNDFYPDMFVDQLVAGLRENGIKVLDLRDWFRVFFLDSERPLFHSFDLHPTSYGQVVMWAIMETMLQEEHPEIFDRLKRNIPELNNFLV